MSNAELTEQQDQTLEMALQLINSAGFARVAIVAQVDNEDGDSVSALHIPARDEMQGKEALALCGALCIAAFQSHPEDSVKNTCVHIGEVMARSVAAMHDEPLHRVADTMLAGLMPSCSEDIEAGVRHTLLQQMLHDAGDDPVKQMLAEVATAASEVIDATREGEKGPKH